MPPATAATTPSWQKLLPAGLVLLSLLVQLLYLHQYAKQVAFFTHPTGDSAIYLELARQTIVGTRPGVFYRAPGYQFLLALLLWPARGNLLWVYLFQILLNCVILVFVWQLARRTAGQLAALLSSLLITFCATLWFYSSKLGTATVVTALLTGAMLIVSSATGWRLLSAGLIYGLAALFWPGSVLVAAGSATLGILVRRLRWAQLGLMLAGGMLVVLPLTISNALKRKELIPISANAGFTFYQGNNRLALGTLAQPPEVYEFTPDGKVLSSVADQETFDSLYIAQRLGRDIKRSTASWFWTRQALHWILHNPASYLALLARKLMLALADYDSATEYDLAMERELVWTLHLGFVGFGLLLGLTVLGIVLSPRRQLWPVYGTVGGTMLAMLVFYVSGRYRLVMLPALAVLGGIGTAGLIRTIRQPQTRSRTRLILGTTLATGTFLLSTVGCELPLRRGSALLKANAYRNLGEVLIANHDYPTAVRILQRSLELQERYADSTNHQEMLDLAYTRKLLTAVNAALRPAAWLLERATAALNTGDTTLALQQALAAIAADSSCREAYLLVSSIYGGQNSHDMAFDLLSKAIRRFPDDPVLIYNQSVAALKVGDFLTALSSAERVLALVPDHPLAERVARQARRRLNP